VTFRDEAAELSTVVDAWDIEVHHAWLGLMVALCTEPTSLADVERRWDLLLQRVELEDEAAAICLLQSDGGVALGLGIHQLGAAAAADWTTSFMEMT
jgi:hypothetical protein